jgi:hypothetical protein
VIQLSDRDFCGGAGRWLETHNAESVGDRVTGATEL